MSIWNTLEIEPTDDISVIKKAYAKLLKIHHPEDDPEGYQRLREAFDQAVKSAKNMKDKPSIQIDEMNASDRELVFSPWTDSDAEIATTTIAEHPVYTFMESVEMLYDNFFARIEQGNWEEILRSDVIWDVQYAAALQDQLIEFFLYHYHFPHSIWELIDQVFRFSEQKNDLVNEYGENTIQFLLERISGEKEMRYDIFEKNADLDFELYFYIREEIQRKLIADELEDVKEELDRAFAMYQRDPELLRMQGIYYLRIDNKEKALQAFSNILLIDKNDPDALLYRAHIQHNLGQFHDAIKDCEHLLSVHPEHMDAMLMMTKCLEKVGEIDKAEKIVQDALQIDRNHVEFLSYFNSFLAQSGKKPNKPGVTMAYVFGWILMYSGMFLRRTWVYILFFILAIITRLPFKYILLLPVVWEAWKFYRLKIKI
ncbi:tetratricopeptide repeat protein [Bacillus cereus group sp. MYBK35-2]|uniref:J domain-containing protein n=1 Tax=unclassified Bacillus cereus group TaxID=2750818 RepID=UPI0029EB3B95|nr:tetratricopeptide repeat protein [Bacillus cereus]MDA2315386.1 tetratricopeptide repeat protein [Bacillus cereus]MDA2499957.1 tetratricopeptide repeat protein [Bacillus cereus]